MTEPAYPIRRQKETRRMNFVINLAVHLSTDIKVFFRLHRVLIHHNVVSGQRRVDLKRYVLLC